MPGFTPSPRGLWGGRLGSRPLLGAPPPLCLRLSGLLQAFRNHSTVSTASGVPSLRREGRPPWNIVNSPILGLAFFRKTDGHSLRGRYGCWDPAGLASRTACPKGPGRLRGRVAWARCEAIGSGGGCGERDRERPVDGAGGSSALADRCRVGMERPSPAGRSAFLPLEGMGEPAGAARAVPQDASSWSCRLGDASLCHVGLALLCTAVTAVSAPHAVLIVSPREMEVLVSYRHYRVMSSPTSVP